MTAFDPFDVHRIACRALELIHAVRCKDTHADYLAARDAAEDRTYTGWRKELADARGPFIAAARTAGYTVETAESRFDDLRTALHDLTNIVFHLPTRILPGGIDRGVVPVGDTVKAADGLPWVNSGADADAAFDAGHKRVWDAINAADKVAATVADEPMTLWHHGETSYSLDKRNQFTVTEEVDNILQAFMCKPVAMDSGTLTDVSGVSNVARVIGKMKEWEGGILASAIRDPGGKKNAGGYYIAVRPAK